MAATAFDSAQPRPVEQVDYRRLLWVAPLAAVVAAIVNAIIFALADAAGLFPDDVLLTSGQPMGLGPVVSVTIIGVVGAVIVYALIGRFSRRPIRLFTIVAAVVLVLSFASPLSIPGAGAGYIAALELLHITTAAIAVGLLTRLARKA